MTSHNENQRGGGAQPLVSVIMPAYNHEKYVEEAVRSVWAQSHANIELLVYNDGSTDRTGEILDRLNDISPVEMRVFHKPNEGLCKTLNRGLGMASGDYLCIIASDDMMCEDKISREVDHLERSPESVGACYTDMRAMDENGAMGDVISYAPVRKTESAFADFLFDRIMLSIQNSTFKMGAVNSVGLFDENILFEDRDYLLRFVKSYKMEYIGGVGVKYRLVEGGLTSAVFENIDEMFKIINKYKNDDVFKNGAYSFDRAIANEWVRFGVRSVEVMDSKAALKYALRALRIDPSYTKAWRLLVVALIPARGARFLLHTYHKTRCRLSGKLAS